MPNHRAAALDYLNAQEHVALERLTQLCSIPSVSTDPDHAADMLKAADWIADQFKYIGLDHIQVFPTQRHPIVFGQYCADKIDAPTVLIYGHYDVQPAAPLELWHSDPFKPEIREDRLYARGASDMKGQVVAAIQAVQAVISTNHLPVNIKFIIEGEEEIGSPSMPRFLREQKQILSADVCLNPDAGMVSPTTPTITYGLRGLAYFELYVYGPDHDLHSGMFGGVVHNPAHALAELIAGMHDEQQRITLPGFYDSVRTLTPDEHHEFSRLPVSRESYLRQTGAPELWGESDFLPQERVGVRPTLDVNGMISGFTGAGSKTIIPSQAMAKISMRLVPDQQPAEVAQQLRQYLEERAPKTIRWELKDMQGGPACIADRNHPAAQALAKAMEQVWNVPPIYKREGGSIPVVGAMQDILGMDSVLTGFGLPDDNIHSPNEKLHLPTWYAGMKALVHFFYNLVEA